MAVGPGPASQRRGRARRDPGRSLPIPYWLGRSGLWLALGADHRLFRSSSAFCGLGLFLTVRAGACRPLSPPGLPAAPCSWGPVPGLSAPPQGVSQRGAALGPGPVCALSLGLFAQTAVMLFVLPSRTLFGGSARGGQALKWVGAPSCHGPVLIGGRKQTSRGGLGSAAGAVPEPRWTCRRTTSSTLAAVAGGRPVEQPGMLRPAS